MDQPQPTPDPAVSAISADGVGRYLDKTISSFLDCDSKKSGAVLDCGTVRRG
jgi:hypothetical protein